MFQRIIVEEWQRTLSVVSILIFFASFLVIAIRAMRMPKEKVQHLESLPLTEDTKNHERTR